MMTSPLPEQVKKPRERIWIGVGNLPGRSKEGDFSTYSVFEYDSLPPITTLQMFEDITNLEDLKKALPNLEKQIPHLFDSPTSCYFDCEGDEPGVFFRDQQDCVVWCWDEKTGEVFDSGSGYAVATSLSEFLTRIVLENVAWHVSHGYKLQISENLEKQVHTYLKHYEKPK
jgi:hypothetical protein